MKEDTDLSATGTLTSADIDITATATAWSIEGSATGTYGSLALTGNTGVWTCTLANGTNGTASAVQNLAAGETVEDTFTVRVTDDQGGFDDQTVTITVTGTNDKPTLTSFAAAVDTVNEDTQVQITLAELKAQGNEADVDGTVDAFVVKAVSSGTLLIGTSAGTATAWVAGTNDTVDATRQAYWTGASNANGTLNAFTVVAKDNGGLESTTGVVQVQVNVTAVNDAATNLILTLTNAPSSDNIPSSSFAQFSVVDPDGGAGGYSYSLLSLGEAVFSTGLAVSPVDASPDLTLSAAGVLAAVAGGSGLEGDRVYELQVQVTQSGATYSESFSIITGTSAGESIGEPYTTGDDIIFGNGGIDIVLAGSGGDTVMGQGGNDTLNGGDGNDRLIGGAGNNTLSGDAGSDILVGDSDNDILIGGAGADTLTSGATNDSDTFKYLSLSDGGDLITDFDTAAASGEDVLNLVDVFNSIGIDVGAMNLSTLVANGYLIVKTSANLGVGTGTNDTRVSIDADGSAGSGAAVVMVTLADVTLTTTVLADQANWFV